MKETITVLCIRNDEYIEGEPAKEINFRVGEEYRCVVEPVVEYSKYLTYDVFNPLDVDPCEPWSCTKMLDGTLGIRGFNNEVRFEII